MAGDAGSIGAAGTTDESATIESLSTSNAAHDASPALKWWTHQRKWLQDTSRLRVCCKARQIGMSATVAAEALHAAVYGETTSSYPHPSARRRSCCARPEASGTPNYTASLPDHCPH